MNATLTLNALGYRAPAYALRNEYEDALKLAAHAAMLAVAPLLGLAAVIALPFAGLATLVWFAIRALPRRVKDIALFLAAPFVGLAYVLAFPAVGAGMLIWAGARAVARK